MVLNLIVNKLSGAPMTTYRLGVLGVLYAVCYAAALALFSQSLRGAADMLDHSGYSVDELIQMVSSKGGTTIAGLEAFRAGGFGEAILAGCEACTKRAYELAK